MSVGARDNFALTAAMKMEVHMAAERIGVVDRVLAKPRDRVHVKEFLILWK